MHDALVVHMLECTSDLPHEVPYCRFVELQVLALFILDELLEVPSFGPLSHNDELIVVDKGIDELDDVGMTQLLHDLHLAQTLISLLLISHVEDLCLFASTLIFFKAKATPCSFSAR